MKLSLLSLLPCVSLALVACSSDPAPDAQAPPSASPTATTEQPQGPPARKLADKRIASTPAENLLIDPEFQSLWSPLDETGLGIYESFVQDGSHGVRFEPHTPVGPGFAALSIDPSAAGATLTMTVLGGRGPLSTRVWVSATKGHEPDVALVSLYDDTSITLSPIESTRTKVGDAEWVELGGTSTGDMPGMLYFVATVNESTRFLAPRVTSAALPPKNALPSRGSHASSAVVDRPSSMRAPSSRAVNAARALERLRSRYVTMRPPPPPARVVERR